MTADRFRSAGPSRESDGMNSVRILALAGSTRRESFNQKLLQVGVAAAREAGADVTVVNLRDDPLPLFDQDDEAERGMPPAAERLKQLFLAHNGLLIASPEYNSSISGVLKNALDWVSRSAPGEPMKAAFLGKTAAIMAASPGGLGGLRGLVHLRDILGNIGVLVLPSEVAVPEAHKVFDANGSLTDERKRESVASLSRTLVDTIRRLNAS